MDGSQSSDPKVRIQQEGVGVQFKPQVGLSAWAKGPRSIALLVIFGFAVIFALLREDLGWIADVSLVTAFLAVLWFSRTIFRRHDPQPISVNFVSSDSTLTFQGFSGGVPLQDALVQALVQRVLQLGSLRLPIPDAKVDVSSGKKIPIPKEEMEKLIQDQKELDAEVVKEVAQVVQASPNTSKQNSS